MICTAHFLHPQIAAQLHWISVLGSLAMTMIQITTVLCPFMGMMNGVDLPQIASDGSYSTQMNLDNDFHAEDSNLDDLGNIDSDVEEAPGPVDKGEAGSDGI